MLPDFEGPLDLLLHLCQTHEIDILNISVSFIAQKYIEYLELMEDMAVEVAADYLVMAAHLAYLKSRELVPSPEPLEAGDEGEEPLDPREELIRRLLEYQKYKHAAENLGSRPIEGRNVFVRGAVLQADSEAGLAEHSVWKLIEHWASTLKKAKPEYTHDVVMDRMSISDRINQIVDLLEAGKGMVRFEDLLGPCGATRGARVGQAAHRAHPARRVDGDLLPRAGRGRGHRRGPQSDGDVGQAGRRGEESRVATGRRRASASRRRCSGERCGCASRGRASTASSPTRRASRCPGRGGPDRPRVRPAG
jgi:chromatin segregation and condensation protein Rec8/ScpA/Scc1 (kleisin family)